MLMPKTWLCSVSLLDPIVVFLPVTLIRNCVSGGTIPPYEEPTYNIRELSYSVLPHICQLCRAPGVPSARGVYFIKWNVLSVQSLIINKPFDVQVEVKRARKK
jgi:hypothetical protein